MEVNRFNPVDPRLGRHVLHDPASRAYSFKASGPVEPINTRHFRKVPVFDQGATGSCVAQSTMGVLGTEPFYSALQFVPDLWTQDYIMALYSEITQNDPFEGAYPPDDTGTSGLSAAKVAKTRGLISGYEHTFSFEDMQAALKERPLITGVPWYRSFYEPDNDGVVSIKDGSPVVGGHEFVLDEINFQDELLGATNSWGDYGVAGRFFIPFETYRRLLGEQADVTVFVPATMPEPKPEEPVVTTESVQEADLLFWDTINYWSSVRHSGSNARAAKAAQAWARSKGLII